MFVDSIWKRILGSLPKQPTEKRVTVTPSIRIPNERNIVFLPDTPTAVVRPGTLISPAQLKLMSPNCDYNVLAPAMDSAARQYGIITPRQIRHWVAHLSVESGYFQHFVENLNYSAERLTEVWPNRFPTIHDAEAYDGNPRLIANKVYGGRMGNNNPDDGYIYRGRGFIQLTGKDNYKAAGDAIGVDLLKNPTLAATPQVASNIAGWYWKQHNLNAIVAVDDNEKIINAGETINTDMIKIMRSNEEDDLVQGTRAINGGLVGLKERRMELWKAMFIWKD